MRHIQLDDLVPSPSETGAGTGELAAALERASLQTALSVQFMAQARLLRGAPGSASGGWTEAEEVADRGVKMLDRLSRSQARLLRQYRQDAAFHQARDAMFGDRSDLVDALATDAMARTDPARPADEAVKAADEQAYRAETLARLRRYEPEWDSLDDFRLQRSAQRAEARVQGDAEALARLSRPQSVAPATPEPASAQPPVLETSGESPAGPVHADAAPEKSVDSENQFPAAPPEPARPSRGAPTGNRNALKSGRHTSEKRAALEDQRAVFRRARRLERQLKDLARAGRPAAHPVALAQTAAPVTLITANLD